MLLKVGVQCWEVVVELSGELVHTHLWRGEGGGEGHTMVEMVVSVKWIMETKGAVNLVQDVYTSGWSTTSGNTNNYLPVSM